jgi:hypothetical protein
MEDLNLEALKCKSDSYQLRFNSALIGGLLILTIGGWAGDHGYTVAFLFSAVGFLGLGFYALLVWLWWAEVRGQIRKARRRSA